MTLTLKDTFPFPDILERFHPTPEGQDPDYDPDNIPEDEDDDNEPSTGGALQPNVVCCLHALDPRLQHNGPSGGPVAAA